MFKRHMVNTSLVLYLSCKMANVRDSDTSLWLHNKLGTSNDSWTSGSICTQLNAEVLKNIKDCFPDLQTQVKLKLLLSFFHIPRRNVEEVTFLFDVLWFCVTVLCFLSLSFRIYSDEYEWEVVSRMYVLVLFVVMYWIYMLEF